MRFGLAHAYITQVRGAALELGVRNAQCSHATCSHLAKWSVEETVMQLRAGVLVTAKRDHDE